MNMFFATNTLDSIPPDSDDIGQSAYVGRLIAEVSEFFRQGTPIKKGDTVSICADLNLKIGQRLIVGSEIGIRKVEQVFFSHALENDGGSLKAIGWSAKLADLPFAIKCQSLRITS